MRKYSHYVQFPLSFLKKTFVNPEKGLQFIIRFGIANFADKIKYDLHDVAKQTLYAYYREIDKMPHILRYFLGKHIDYDEDYNGFAGKNFDPAETKQLASLLKKNADMQTTAIRIYQLRQAADNLKITLPTFNNYFEDFNRGKMELADFEKKYGKDPWPSCKIGMLIDFRDQPTDIDLLRAYIAIKSIIGQKNFAFTYKSVILSRMLGAKSNDVLKVYKRDAYMKATYKKYSKRYHMDKLLTELEDRKFIVKVSYPRGIFISTQATSKKELAEMIVARKAEKSKKREELEAREIILKG